MISMYFQKSRIFTKNNKKENGWVRDDSVRFLRGREILNCNWIMREFYFGKFLVIKSTGE